MTGSDVSHSSDEADGVVVFSPSELRLRGLLLVNYTRRRIKRAKTKRNNERFAGHFGASPAVVANFFESRIDLVTNQHD